MAYSYLDLHVLYEDNHIIVVEKKPGILSQKDQTGDLDIISVVKEYLIKKYNKPGDAFLGSVQRLDRMVGGVMVFAKTSKALERLQLQMRNRNIHKKYYALVWGDIIDSGYYVDYMIKNEEIPRAFIVDENTQGAKIASLSYKKIKTIDYLDKKLSMVDINLETGRYHQIRLQFASRGHPIYGDQKYGLKYNKKSIILGLWAYSLEFIHPVSKELMSFKELPKSRIWKEFFN